MKALVAMSGSVDSSVAAWLMKNQGFDCIGVTMKLFQNTDIGLTGSHTCCSLDDVEDARSVARLLKIPYYVFNFSDCFRQCVMEKFVQSYECGITPNPCIDCNRYLKFEKLLHRAQVLGFDYVATGHYARVEQDEVTGRYLFKKALDASKDQSYVLYTMTQEQLAHTLFPLGTLTKQEVRSIAQQHSFVTAHKHDSQDICFVPSGEYAEFIKQYTGKAYPPGDFIDRDGNVLGTHRGIIHYTIGQRRGLSIATGKRQYVCAVDPEQNRVILGQDKDVYTKSLIARDINLISQPTLEEPIRLKAKVRYRHTEQWSTVTQLEQDTLKIVFDMPQRAVAKGQSVVLYDGETVVGGGIIVETFPESCYNELKSHGGQQV